MRVSAKEARDWSEGMGEKKELDCSEVRRWEDWTCRTRERG